MSLIAEPASIDGPGYASAVPIARSEAPLPVELPLFCEACGYSLHALPPSRCEHCTVMHFRCPECGHQQPLMTIRPAVHKMLSRLRMVGLLAWVFFKLNFFVWLLFAWGAMGAEWSYQYNWAARSANPQGFTGVPYIAREVDLEVLLAFSLFAFGFGLFGRMLLLRWRRPLLVGIILALLVCAAIYAGVRFTIWERRLQLSPFTTNWAIIMGVTAGWIILGGVLVWPIWVGLVRLFLPARAAELLLKAQRTSEFSGFSFQGSGTPVPERSALKTEP